MRTIGMSDYTVGEDCFDELPGALAEYGRPRSRSSVASGHWPQHFPESSCAGRYRRRYSGDARLRYQQHTRQYRQGRKLPRMPESRRAHRLRRRQGARHREDRSHRAQEDRLHRPDDLLQLLRRDRHCRRLQRRRLARGYSYPNRPAHIFINPRSSPRLRRSTSGPAWAMPCLSSPRSSTPRVPVI